jgi:hypothetical protein
MARGQDSTAWGALHWRLIGPFRGGRSLAVAGIPGNSSTFYFGAVDGGVWRTDNAALTWEPIFDAQPIASIGAMAVAPSDPRVIYVGTGEAAIRSDITLGGGVFKSSDGGAHWESLGLGDTRQIGKVLVNATNADIVLIAALGHAYGPNAERAAHAVEPVPAERGGGERDLEISGRRRDVDGDHGTRSSRGAAGAHRIGGGAQRKRRARVCAHWRGEGFRHLSLRRWRRELDGRRSGSAHHEP